MANEASRQGSLRSRLPRRFYCFVTCSRTPSISFCTSTLKPATGWCRSGCCGLFARPATRPHCLPGQLPGSDRSRRGQTRTAPYSRCQFVPGGQGGHVRVAILRARHPGGHPHQKEAERPFDVAQVTWRPNALPSVIESPPPSISSLSTPCNFSAGGKVTVRGTPFDIVTVKVTTLPAGRARTAPSWALPLSIILRASPEILAETVIGKPSAMAHWVMPDANAIAPTIKMW